MAGRKKEQRPLRRDEEIRRYQEFLEEGGSRREKKGRREQKGDYKKGLSHGRSVRRREEGSRRESRSRGAEASRRAVSKRGTVSESARPGKRRGSFTAWLQLAATVIFLGSLYLLNLLPWEYTVLITAVLLLLLLFAFAGRRSRRGGLGAALRLLLCLFLCGGTYLCIKANSAVDTIAKGSVQNYYASETAASINGKAGEVQVKREPFAVYVSGIDVFGELETSSRSDVNILILVNPSSHQMLLITTPRDCYLELPGVSEGQRDKLTHAGLYGVDVSMAALEQLYGIDVPFYARVNFSSFIQIIDALGGVDVDSEFAFTTGPDAGLVMEVSQGLNHFNGEQALAFSRERQNLPDGDNQRGRNQQAVIKAILKKAVSPAVLPAVNGLFEGVSGNVETNMTKRQLQGAVQGQLEPGVDWNIQSMSLEGTPDQAYCYSYSGGPLYVTWPDEASLAEICGQIEALQSGAVLEGD